ncbi:hypothetical protein GMMP15_1130006 [Candidatus Magnetomoraceae bacterium gMMP-15]
MLSYINFFEFIINFKILQSKKFILFIILSVWFFSGLTTIVYAQEPIKYGESIIKASDGKSLPPSGLDTKTAAPKENLSSKMVLDKKSYEVGLNYFKKETYTITASIESKEWTDKKNSSWFGELLTFNVFDIDYNTFNLKGFKQDNNRFILNITQKESSNKYSSLYVYVHGFNTTPSKLSFILNNEWNKLPNNENNKNTKKIEQLKFFPLETNNFEIANKNPYTMEYRDTIQIAGKNDLHPVIHLYFKNAEKKAQSETPKPTINKYNKQLSKKTEFKTKVTSSIDPKITSTIDDRHKKVKTPPATQHIKKNIVPPIGYFWDIKGAGDTSFGHLIVNIKKDKIVKSGKWKKTLKNMVQNNPYLKTILKSVKIDSSKSLSKEKLIIIPDLPILIYYINKMPFPDDFLFYFGKKSATNLFKATYDRNNRQFIIKEKKIYIHIKDDNLVDQIKLPLTKYITLKSYTKNIKLIEKKEIFKPDQFEHIQESQFTNLSQTSSCVKLFKQYQHAPELFIEHKQCFVKNITNDVKNLYLTKFKSSPQLQKFDLTENGEVFSVHFQPIEIKKSDIRKSKSVSDKNKPYDISINRNNQIQYLFTENIAVGQNDLLNLLNQHYNFIGKTPTWKIIKSGKELQVTFTTISEEK